MYSSTYMQHISVHSGRPTAALCPPWWRVRPAARAGPGGGRTGRETGSGYTPMYICIRIIYVCVRIRIEIITVYEVVSVVCI